MAARIISAAIMAPARCPREGTAVGRSQSDGVCFAALRAVVPTQAIRLCARGSKRL